MSAHFDWSKIPGIHTENSPVVENAYPFPVHPMTQQTPTGEQNMEQTSATGYNDNSSSSLAKIMNTLSIGKLPSHSSMENLGRQSSESNMTRPVTREMRSMDNLRSPEFRVHASSTDTIIANDNASVVLAVSKEELSAQESKTYNSWYHTIKRRKARFPNRAISIDDVLKFMGNFGIPDHTKERMKILFGRKADALNESQFFALMRLIAHTMAGEPLKNSLIKMPVAIPRPIPILAKTHKKAKSAIANKVHKHANSNDKHKLDINSFTEMLLTGQTPAAQHEDAGSKKVKFSEVVTFSPPPMTEEEYAAMIHAEQLETAAAEKLNQTARANDIDYSLPMDQLLERLKQQQAGPPETSQTTTQNDTPPPQQTNENEEEILKDVKIDSFQKVTHLDPNTGTVPQPLKPNLTGSASKSMKEHFMHQFDQTFKFDPTPAGEGGSIMSLSAEPQMKQDSDPLGTMGMSGSQAQPQSVSASSLSSMFGNHQAQPQLHQQPQSLERLGSDAQMPSLKALHYQVQSTSSVTNDNIWPNRSASPNAPPAPVSRSRSSSATAPALPPPPPPRSRKSSSAPQFPPPAAAGQSGQPGQPNLPPKPMLSSQQKQRYISSMPSPHQSPQPQQPQQAQQAQQHYMNTMQQQQQQQQQQYLNAMQQQQQQQYYYQQQAQQGPNPSQPLQSPSFWPGQSQQSQQSQPAWPQAPW